MFPVALRRAAFAGGLALLFAGLGSASVVDDEVLFELDSFKKELRSVGRLSEEQEVHVLEDLMAALTATGAPQLALVQAVLDDYALDPAALPSATNYGPHDPEVYPPGPKRRKVRSGTSSWKKLVKKIGATDEPRQTPGRFRYDFAAGEIVITDPKFKKGSRLSEAFQFALMGFPPDQDLAEAILLSRLDEVRPFRKEAEFFAADYADLKAKAFDGISLYKVWSHQIPLDVPDVDLRAYAKIVKDAGLPEKIGAATKDKWYPQMSQSLFDLRAHRQAATAAAAFWVQSDPKVPGGWTASRNVMHALSASLGGNSGALIAAFHEQGAALGPYALETVKAKGNEGWNAGNARRDELAAARLKIRQAAIGALERALAE